MGLSRRQFTKEFKLPAVRRLEQGVSIGEAARALPACQTFATQSIRPRRLVSKILRFHPIGNKGRQVGGTTQSVWTPIEAKSPS